MAKPRKPVTLQRARPIGHCLLVVLAISVLATFGARAADAPDTRAAIHRQSAGLATLRDKIKAAVASIAQARGKQERLQEAVNAAEEEIAQAGQALAVARARSAAADADLRRSEQQRAAAQQQLAEQRRVLAAQLRAQYMLGGQDRWRLILSGEDPGLTGRLLADYAYVQRARAAAIAGVQARMTELDALEAQVRAQRDASADLQKQREAALVRLKAEQDTRTRAVAALKAGIDRQGTELAALRAAEKRMQDLLATLQKQLAREPFVAGDHLPFAKLRGHLSRPVSGAVLARFGTLRAGGPLTWKGTWIGAPQGTPVHACARGRVVYVGWVSSYGLIVLLEHDGGYFTLYGHAAHASVQVGETVAAGQIIAAAGDTGGYERSGVYFEIRHNGNALDPGQWFKR